MLVYYKNSLIDIFNRVHKIQSNPFKHAEEIQELQEILIKRITYVEKRIRQNRKTIKTLKSSLRLPETRPTKQEAREIKQSIKILNAQIDSYQELLIIFRWAGDALAFLFIDRWELKPLGLGKETPGFISGKRGAKLERKIFREIQKMSEIIVISNDLTNCLRYGDITIVDKNGKYFIVEVKSKIRRDRRQSRQIEKTQKILTFLAQDRTDELYGIKGPVKRVETTSRGVFYLDDVNTVLQNARSSGQYYLEIEKGLFYFSIHNPTINKVKHVLEEISKQCTGEIIVGQVNKRTYNESIYYPPTLSIVNDENLYLFCTGELILGVTLDAGVINKKINSMGFQAEFLKGDGDSVLTIENPKAPENMPNKIGIGGHFLIEFLLNL